MLGRHEAEAFEGTERFRIVRRLGSGAFGVVYEAWDREDNAAVALKVLRFAEADALYRFKKGIRALAGIDHPNLVALHGLEQKDGWWFLSMELVQGKDFIEAVRGIAWESTMGRDAQARSSSITSTVSVLDRLERFDGRAPEDGRPAQVAAGASEEVEVDSDRLRLVVGQLASGLDTLHSHGRLHRDIKPPNVMVTPEGRVVLLDFGLVTELERWDLLESADSSLAGTPAYMAPEQADGGPGIPASDWYAVGVMLYQALTGTLPFTGSLFDVLHRKRSEAPPDPRLLAPRTPDDLAELCLGLMATDPEERLGGAEVLARTSVGQASANQPSLPFSKPRPAAPDLPFVGRREALATLREALATSGRTAVSVYVSGPSGMGKTALVHHFLSETQLNEVRGNGGPEREVVILPGRCYLQESVPYKALDSLIDALSRYLTRLPRREVEGYLPASIGALARLFPVLRRVSAVTSAPRHRAQLDASDPQGLRRRAFSALRELLGRLAEHKTLILFIDDLQWGDVDSFHLLDDLLRPPEPPPIVFIGSYRSEDRETSPFLRALAEHLTTLERRGGEVRHVLLDDLRAEEAAELVLSIAPSADEGGGMPAGLSADELRSIVREGGGSPLFLTELVHYARESRQLELPRPASVPDVDGSSGALRGLIMARVAHLGEAERRLLEMIAVAGRPLPAAVVAGAAGLSSGVGVILERLTAARLIRRLAAGDRLDVEAYHDRIRESLVTSLHGGKLRECHALLAEALEEAGDADPETLAIHHRGAGHTVQALSYARSAADQAEETLAFERAARLFRMVIELEGPLSPSRFSTQIRLGHALANAGHSHEAADILIGAVEHSGTFDPLEVQRDAAEQLLISGHIERGLLILRHVLRTVGMKMEESRWRALADLRWLRLRLRLRGRRFKETPSADCDPVLLRRIDVCWSVEIGLCLVDVLHASHFHARHLLLALQAGEPQRVARGLAMEVFFGVMDGGDSRPALIEARRLGERLADPYISNLADMASGMRDCVRGNWRRAHNRLVVAEEHLREECAGVVWELDTVKHFRTLAMLFLGDWAALFHELPRLLKHAQVRGDHYLEVHLRQWVESRHLLARDEPAEAAAEVRDAIADWSYKGFHFQHFGHLVAEVEIDLYRGDGVEALSRMEHAVPRVERSMIQRLEIVFVLCSDLRARAAVAAAVQTRDAGKQGRLLRRAHADARRLGKLGSPWTTGLSELLLAGIASVRLASDRAAAHLETAEEAFTTSDMKLHAAAVQRRSGEILGIADQVKQADRVIEREGIVRPDRLARMLAPGCWGSSEADVPPS